MYPETNNTYGTWLQGYACVWNILRNFKTKASEQIKITYINILKPACWIIRHIYSAISTIRSFREFCNRGNACKHTTVWPKALVLTTDIMPLRKKHQVIPNSLPIPRSGCKNFMNCRASSRFWETKLISGSIKWSDRNSISVGQSNQEEITKGTKP